MSQDYGTAGPVPLMISPDLSYHFPIINDTFVERMENFFLQLTSTDPGVSLSPDMAEVLISDDDGN